MFGNGEEQTKYMCRVKFIYRVRRCHSNRQTSFPELINGAEILFGLSDFSFSRFSWSLWAANVCLLMNYWFDASCCRFDPVGCFSTCDWNPPIDVPKRHSLVTLLPGFWICLSSKSLVFPEYQHQEYHLELCVFGFPLFAAALDWFDRLTVAVLLPPDEWRALRATETQLMQVCSLSTCPWLW